MRILLDTHMMGEGQTGIGRYWSNLTRSLSAYPDLELLRYANTATDETPGGTVYIPRWDHGMYRIARGFPEAVARLRPDILHVSNFGPLNPSSVPVVTTVHDMCYLSPENGFSLSSRLAFRAFLKRSLMLSRAVVSVSQNTKERIIAAFGILPDKVHVIHEAADPVFSRKTNAAGKGQRAARDRHITGDFFLVVGAIEQRKRPNDIIGAFRHVLLQDAGRGTQLVFAGPNRLGAAFVHRHRDLIRGNRVLLLGHIPDSDLAELYKAGKALIYFSRCEGFGLPLVEAMACSVPIICSDIPLFHEIVGDAGIFCPSSAQLARSMGSLLGSSSLFHALRMKSQDRSRNFSWETSARKLRSLYLSILS